MPSDKKPVMSVTLHERRSTSSLSRHWTSHSMLWRWGPSPRETGGRFCSESSRSPAEPGPPGVSLPCLALAVASLARPAQATGGGTPSAGRPGLADHESPPTRRTHAPVCLVAGDRGTPQPGSEDLGTVSFTPADPALARELGEVHLRPGTKRGSPRPTMQQNGLSRGGASAVAARGASRAGQAWKQPS
jgi:hypothetical protein